MRRDRLAAALASSPGAGLVWGIPWAVVLWLGAAVGAPSLSRGDPMLDVARTAFPWLVALVLTGGALGVASGVGGRAAGPAATRRPGPGARHGG